MGCWKRRRREEGLSNWRAPDLSLAGKFPSPQDFLAFDQVSARTEDPPPPPPQNVIKAARSLWSWAAGTPRGKIPGGPLPPAEVTSVWSELEGIPPTPATKWILAAKSAHGSFRTGTEKQDQSRESGQSAGKMGLHTPLRAVGPLRRACYSHLDGPQSQGALRCFLWSRGSSWKLAPLLTCPVP